MLKKINFIVLMFLTMFVINICNVTADYICAYKYEGFSFSFKFNTTNKTLYTNSIDGCNIMLGGRCSASELDVIVIEHDENLKELKTELLKERETLLFSGTCDSTLLVFKSWYNSSQKDSLEVLFNDTLEANARKYVEGLSGAGQYKDLKIGGLSLILIIVRHLLKILHMIAMDIHFSLEKLKNPLI